MISLDQHRLLYKIAHAYYLQGETQQQIANRFGLSRIKVSRLLAKARTEDVVSIGLSPPPSGLADLEHALENKYNLQEVVLVPAEENQDALTQALGQSASGVLMRRLQGRETVGLTWGSTMMALVDALSYQPFPEVTVVQMTGGLGQPTHNEHSTELTRRVAQKLQSKLLLLPAPGVVTTKEAAEALRSDRQIAETLTRAASADIAVVGLGVLNKDSVIVGEESILRPSEFEAIQQVCAVGDVALRFIDCDGIPLDLELNERIIGVNFEQIRKIPTVIGVAGGAQKFEVITAVLKSGILDVLVTDSDTGTLL